jgi:hypothetical protein
MPAIEKAKPPTLESPDSKTPERPVQTTTEATPSGTTVSVPRYHGTPVPEEKRLIKRRHPFDVYFDQLKTLKRLAIKDKEQGLPGSESAMVREALDDYFKKRDKGR